MCTILGDSPSQLLQTITKMSPDGANFLHKCFQGLGQDPCKILASQFFSVERCSSVQFAPYLRISNGCSADLRRAETLTFCMDTTLTPRNICAKNQRHLATFLLLSVKAENGYLLRWYTYESNFYTKMLLKGSRFQKYITCLRTLRFDTFRVLVQSDPIPNIGSRKNHFTSLMLQSIAQFSLTLC